MFCSWIFLLLPSSYSLYADILCVIADGNTIRNKTRTPNILQNADRPLPSPVATMKLNESDASNTSPNTNKTMVSQKLQTLKQRKLELEKQLQEKNTLLQNLCREEAKLIGCSSYSLNELGNISGIDCSDGSNSGITDRIQSSNNLNNNNSTLTRRHIDTGFKLPENLLNSTEDNINQLLLSKQIQQQISQASLRFANDATQNKVSDFSRVFYSCTFFVVACRNIARSYQFAYRFSFNYSRFAVRISKAMIHHSKRSRASITR